MLIKAKKFGKITLYRRGYGHLLKLEQIMDDYGILKDIMNYITKGARVGIVQKEILKIAIKKFTDVKFPALFVRFNYKKSLQLLYEIMKFNNPPIIESSEKKDAKEIKLNVDDLSVFVYNTLLEAGYPYSIEQAMNEIDYPTFVQIKKDLDKRKYINYKTMWVIQHNPEYAIKMLDESQGIEVLTDWRDA
jgi:hypothetical protein